MRNRCKYEADTKYSEKDATQTKATGTCKIKYGTRADTKKIRSGYTEEDGQKQALKQEPTKLRELFFNAKVVPASVFLQIWCLYKLNGAMGFQFVRELNPHVNGI